MNLILGYSLHTALSGTPRQPRQGSSVDAFSGVVTDKAEWIVVDSQRIMDPFGACTGTCHASRETPLAILERSITLLQDLFGPFASSSGLMFASITLGSNFAHVERAL